MGNLPSSGNIGGIRNIMILLPAFFTFHLIEIDRVPHMLLPWLATTLLVYPCGAGEAVNVLTMPTPYSASIPSKED